MPLSNQAVELLRALVQRINTGTIRPGEPDTYPRYGQIHDALDLQMHGETVGQSLKHQGLAELAHWTHDNAYPAVTGLIVSQDTFMPGLGYFELFNRTENDFSWWKTQIQEALLYDWQQFLRDTELDTENVDILADGTSGSDLLHICIADPTRGHMELLEHAAATMKAEFDWWNVTKLAKYGEQVVFYATKPISAFVAVGSIGRKTKTEELPKESKYRDQPCYWMNNARLLNPQIPLTLAKSYLPEWAYLSHPVVTSIPNNRTSQSIVDRFIDLLRQCLLPHPEANDLAEPPERIQTTVCRILRDTELSRRIKQLHSYRCQICGLSIELPDGRFYAEGHHMKPLGSPHNGPDTEANILCLCPNHHAAVDLGAIDIDLHSLSMAPGHMVGAEFVEYHNTVIWSLT
jgi:hypothetical protein